MKAIEYAEQYKSNPNAETLKKIAFSFLMEIEDIAQKRNIKSNDGLLSVLDEINLKWKAFVRKTGDPSLREDGIEKLIKSEFSFIGPFWPRKTIDPATGRG